MNDEPGRADVSRQVIIKAALEEFARMGYRRASTNTIMKQAGLAKGLLFHHFSTKKGLYLACLEHVLREIQRELNRFLQEMPADLFERLSSFLQWKYELSRSAPREFRFLFSVAGLPPELRQAADELLLTWRKSNAQLLAEYDTTLWNPVVDQKQALALIVLVFEAIDMKWIQHVETSREDEARDASQLLDHARQMLDVLRSGFYVD